MVISTSVIVDKVTDANLISPAFPELGFCEWHLEALLAFTAQRTAAALFLNYDSEVLNESQNQNGGKFTQS